jgi:hypothetical protein
MEHHLAIASDGQSKFGKCQIGHALAGSFEGKNVTIKKVALWKIHGNGDNNLRLLRHPNVVKLYHTEDHGGFRLVNHQRC